MLFYLYKFGGAELGLVSVMNKLSDPIRVSWLADSYEVDFLCFRLGDWMPEISDDPMLVVAIVFSFVDTDESLSSLHV